MTINDKSRLSLSLVVTLVAGAIAVSAFVLSGQGSASTERASITGRVEANADATVRNERAIETVRVEADDNFRIVDEKLGKIIELQMAIMRELPRKGGKR